MDLKLCKWIWFAIVAVLLASCRMSTPISPGELTEPHKELEGTSNCTQCHTLGKRISDKKCLECHKLIKQGQKDKIGYHGSKEVRKSKCIKCHSDHHGRKFEIIHFDTTDFDHSLTGYMLEGKHKEKTCSDCHQKKRIRNKKLLNRSVTFMGLNTKCLTCHRDYHQNTLPASCEKCHDFKGFKPASQFDHKNADFRLEGKHKDVKCEKCHPRSKIKGQDFQQFAGLKFNSCNSCHKDEHENKFGQDCEKCHTVNSFRGIKNKELFDHRLTGFLLKGKHKVVKCEKCHKGKFTDPVAHNVCNDCHQDYHKGQLTLKGKVRDCGDCHTVNNFTVTTYKLAQHNQGRFRLKGAHEATPCIDCHRKSKKWKFKNIGFNCVDCHKNIHKNYMTAKYYPGEDCRICHEAERWKDVKNFNHNGTKFALLGKHAEQNCRKCHFPELNGKKEQKFSGLSNNCNSCHIDKHYDQFKINGATDCIRCHAFDNWKAVNFDHSNTKFKLDGSHDKVACDKCHKKITRNSTEFVNYKIKDYRCEACH